MKKSLVRTQVLLGLMFVVFVSCAMVAGAFSDAGANAAVAVKEIPVLNQSQFQEMFGNNAEIPRTHDGIVALAQSIFGKAKSRTLQSTGEECGEYRLGLLYAALSNPEVSKTTVAAVEAVEKAAVPSLPKSYISGHFRIWYTDNDSDSLNNVTLAEVVQTAQALNNAWNIYVNYFQEPKSFALNGVKTVDVRVYYLGSSLLGQTSSSWNYIDLNSSMVVKHSYRRLSVPAHELFHRVEYQYGYVSGTAGMSWAVEGCASWSQKLCAASVGDWMVRMNQGLNNPDGALLNRSYDACYFWVYLGERAATEHGFIKACWANYSTNGKNMKNAVDNAIKSQLSSSYSFNSCAMRWHYVNFAKDTANAVTDQDYLEDEWSRPLGGPLAHVPRVTSSLAVGGQYQSSTTVSAYGADYFVFNLAAGVKKITITLAGSGNNFGYAAIQMKDNKWVAGQWSTSGGIANATYSPAIDTATVNQIAFCVTGVANGGSYTITAKAL